MNLTDNQMDALAGKIASKIVVRCDCGLSAEAQAEMPHLLGMIKDIGSNDYARGIEVVRDMGKRYCRMDTLSGHITRAILGFLMVSTMSGVGYMVWCGIKSFFKELKP